MSSLTTLNCVGRSLVDQLSCCFQRGDMDGQPSMAPPFQIPGLKPRKSRIRMDVVMLLQGKRRFFPLLYHVMEFCFDFVSSLLDLKKKLFV